MHLQHGLELTRRHLRRRLVRKRECGPPLVQALEVKDIQSKPFLSEEVTFIAGSSRKMRDGYMGERRSKKALPSDGQSLARQYRELCRLRAELKRRSHPKRCRHERRRPDSTRRRITTGC
jgi:hypothetical protein